MTEITLSEKKNILVSDDQMEMFLSPANLTKGGDPERPWPDKNTSYIMY